MPRSSASLCRVMSALVLASALIGCARSRSQVRTQTASAGASVAFVPSTASAAGSDASGAPGSSSEQPSAELAQITRVFPQASLATANGQESLNRELGSVLSAIARTHGNHGNVQVAFVLDRSQREPLGGALQLALAAQRSKLISGRYALVWCGHDRKAWFSQVATAFGTDSYAVLRAAGDTPWQPDGSALAASVLGLWKATTLDWQSAASPDVVLLTDDRDRASYGSTLPAPAPNVLSATRTWAHASGATLHVIRCHLDGADGLAIEGEPTPSQAMLERGTPPSVVAGLFRSGRHAPASTVQELRTELRAALSDDDAGTTRNAALIVDTSGLMGESLAHLSAQSDLLRDFVARPNHELALLRWDAGKPAVVAPPTRDARAIVQALSALRRGTPGDYTKDLDSALDAARRLPWPSAVQPVVLVLSAAPARGIGRDVLAWTDTANVRLTLIEPLPSLTAPLPQQR